MNREEITKLAREAGFVGMDGDHGALRRFAALVVAAEREECVRLVWETPEPEDEYVSPRQAIAKSIKGRGDT